MIKLLCFLLLPGLAYTQDAAGFTATVQPFLAKYCYQCHNAKVAAAELNLEKFNSAETVVANRERWGIIMEMLETGAMPPRRMARPDAAALKQTGDWIKAEFARQDR